MFNHQPTISALSLGDLKSLIKTGEGTYLEFKRTISNPEKIARELCAFANTKGGILLIGVDDNGAMVGVTSFHEEHYLLVESTDFYCNPPIKHKIEIFELGDREIVLVKVEEAEVKPVYVQVGKKRYAYERIKDKSVRVSREKAVLLENSSRTEGITFNYGPNEQKLFRYLNEYEKITVNEFSNLINLNKKKAAQILVNMVSIGVLNLFSSEKSDYFTLSNKAF